MVLICHYMRRSSQSCVHVLVTAVDQVGPQVQPAPTRRRTAGLPVSNFRTPKCKSRPYSGNLVRVRARERVAKVLPYAKLALGHSQVKAPQEYDNQGCGQKLPEGSFGPSFNKNQGRMADGT